MKLLKRILLHTDFDEASGDAMETAVAVAREFDSEILPIHVLREVPDAPAGLDLGAIRDDLNGRLAEMCDAIAKRGVRVAKPLLAEGPAFQRILEHARAEAVNVVIVGAAGSRETRHGRLAPMVERLARRSTKPLWVVATGAGPEFERILCPVDFSEHSARALDNAIHLARRFRSELTVLSVAEPLRYFLGIKIESLGALREGYREDHDRKLEEFLDRFDTHGVRVGSLVLEGDPGPVIVDRAKRDKADLIVMGSAGRSGLARLFLGSVAGSVLRSIPCSVITVKSESAIQVEFEGEVRSLTERFDRGLQLLQQGHPREALRELEAYVALDPMSPPAWEAIATAHARLHREAEAQCCRGRAEQIRETLWKRAVEADARRQHWMWKRR
jgi:nucleotide-binding universal stress UspA family protein